jgi:hypothetical protein
MSLRKLLASEASGTLATRRELALAPLGGNLVGLVGRRDGDVVLRADARVGELAVQRGMGDDPAGVAAAEDGGVGLAVAVVVLRDRRDVGVAGEARRGGGSPGGKVDENLPVPGR